MTDDEARDVADAVSLCEDPWPLTYIAAALSRSFAQFDWPALNGYLGRTLAEELTVPDDSWLTDRGGDPYCDLRPLLGLHLASDPPRRLATDEQLKPWAAGGRYKTTPEGR